MIATYPPRKLCWGFDRGGSNHLGFFIGYQSV